MEGNKNSRIFVFNIDGLIFFADISDCFSLYCCLGSVSFPYFLFYSFFFPSLLFLLHILPSFFLLFAISECTHFYNSLCCLLPSIFCWSHLFLLPSRCACLQILRANRQLVRVWSTVECMSSWEVNGRTQKDSPTWKHQSKMAFENLTS